MMEPQAQAPLSLFGKMPSQGDFLRVNMQGAVCAAFEAWLANAVEQARGKLPTLPVRFMLTLGDAQERVIGAWVPSVDAVGREFPLAAFHPLPSDLTDAPWSLLPAFYTEYLEAIEGRLMTLRTGDPALLLSAVTAVALPHASAVPAAWREGQVALTQETIGAFAARNTTGGDLDGFAYGIFTVQYARSQSAEPLTLDLVADNEVDLFAWLEIARVLNVQDTAPSLLWSEGDKRALLMLGAPATLALAFLLDPAHPSQRRWPLSTPRAQARQHAREALAPVVQKAFATDDSLAGLLAALGQELRP